MCIQDTCFNALKNFTHNVFCGIIPGAVYDVTVRTLPVYFDSVNKDHETKATRRYPDDSENASPSKLYLYHASNEFY